MFKRIDRSAFLSRVLDGMSAMLAKQRGLPVVIGIALIVIALVIQVIEFFVGSPALELIGMLLHGVGAITALVGLLLATPLGK